MIRRDIRQDIHQTNWHETPSLSLNTPNSLCLEKLARHEPIIKEREDSLA